MSGLRGKINYVSLSDFVTYDSVTFYPGEYLNIIIGPNGTGKSTLVAAIVLGMGGTPKVLSRALNIGDYVKNGKETATIRIGIYNSDGPQDIVHFQRDIEIAGQTRFSINDKKCTQASFLQTVAAMNIQVDNLCQFLPQDRVQDFAKQNAQELLASTQCSVCDPRVEETFGQLKEMRQQQKSQASTREGNIQRLADYEKRNEALEGQIKAMEARNEMVRDLDVCNKKKAWMEFEDLYIKHHELQGDLKLANELYMKYETELRPLKEQIEAIGSKKNAFERRIKASSDQCVRQLNEISAFEEKRHQHTTELTKNYGDYEFARKSNADRIKELEDENQVQRVLIQDLKLHRSEVGSEDDRKAKMDDLNGRIDKCKGEKELLLHQRRMISKKLDEDIKPPMNSIQNKINSAKSIADRKLELLRTKFENAYRATLWLRNNRNLFKGKVYEPMLLELNVMDSNNAKYIENCVSRQDLIAFGCENKEDMALMHKKLRNEERLNINVIHTPPADTVNFAANRPIEQLAQFGFHSYLIDLIEGPVPLLNSLCKINRLHMVPVGNDQTYEMSDSLPGDIGLYFSTNHRFQVNRSKYSNQISSMSNEIQSHNLLNIGIDNAMLQRLQREYDALLRKSDQMKNQRIQLEEHLQQLDAQSTELLAQRQEIQEKVKKLELYNEKLRRQVQKIQRIAPPLNLETEFAKMKAKNSDILKRMFELLAKKSEVIEKVATLRVESALEEERFNKFMHANAELNNIANQRQAEVDKAKKTVDRVREMLDRNKVKCKEKQIEAKRLTDGKTPSDTNNFPYKKAFDKLPDVMAELLEHINDLEGQINCLGEGSDSVVVEFEQRKQQIEQLRATIANFDKEHMDLELKMVELHDLWFPEMQKMVTTINTCFADYMTAMQFAGEVELTFNNPRDYDEYGIDIRVKYRNHEKLQTLDRNVQSGGERAVAIAIYSLSLQQLSHVPFRCVDEINQGMDSTNERKIFNMLVEQTTQPGKSQYFFVTPKLLPNLNYNEHMNVHIVFNGRFVKDAKMFERWH